LEYEENGPRKKTKSLKKSIKGFLSVGSRSDRSLTATTKMYVIDGEITLSVETI